MQSVVATYYVWPQSYGYQQRYVCVYVATILNNYTSISTHKKPTRGRNTILLLDTWKLCVELIIGKPRPQATAIQVTFDRHEDSMIGLVSLVVSTVMLRLTPEVGEATMTAQAMSTRSCTASVTHSTTSAGTADKSIYLSKQAE